ncbi:hypothetical protein [Polaromonas sp. DSR2-3-2]|uniref:hypothetical protein n=1 Tax=unclassified Polaromonas TaxID=2638319 RepID=UPI003CF85C1E
MKRINFGFRHGQNCMGEEVVHIPIQAISNAVAAEQLRYVQAEIFSLRFALSLEQTAEVTGLSIGWASKQLANSFTERPHAIAPYQRVGAAQTKLHTGRRGCCIQAVSGAIPRGRQHCGRSTQASP